MVGKKKGEVTPWSAHLHPRILPNGWPPIPISAMVKLHMCCHPTLGPTSSVYNFLWIQIDDHQKRNWVEKNQPFDDVCFYFPYSSSWIYHQKSPFLWRFHLAFCRTELHSDYIQLFERQLKSVVQVPRWCEKSEGFISTWMMHLWKVWPIFIVGTHSRNTMGTPSNNANIITRSLVRNFRVTDNGHV